MAYAHTTTDHSRIKQWAEKRGGHPVVTQATGKLSSSGKIDTLRIDFDPPDTNLASVDWETFFTAFERKELAFMYQDVTMDGQLSRFNQFIDRHSTSDDTIEDSEATQISSSAFASSRFVNGHGRTRQ